MTFEIYIAKKYLYLFHSTRPKIALRCPGKISPSPNKTSATDLLF